MGSRLKSNIFIVLLLVLLTFNIAGADPITLDDGTVTVLSEQNLQTQIEEVELAVGSVDSGQDHILIQTPKGKLYTFSLLPTADEDRETYGSMSEQDQKKFQVNRLFYLSRLATVLEKTELTLGSGSLIKNKFKRIFSRKPKNPPSDEQAVTDSVNEAKRSWKEQATSRAQEFNKFFLEKTDEYLWKQAKVVTKQNEFSFTTSIGVIAQTGIKDKGIGGSFSVGVNVGFNSDDKAMVFEIFIEWEKFKKTFYPMFLVGVVPKAGVLMKVQGEDGELRSRSGNSLNPPGAPVYFVESDEMFIVGGSSSAFTSFPPVISDWYAYINSTTRRPVLRMSFGSMHRNFMRMKVAGQDKLVSYFQPISDFIKEIDVKTKAASFIRTCGSVLNTPIF